MILQTIREKVETLTDELESFKLQSATNTLISLSRLGNQYLNEKEPWKIIKTDREKARFSILRLRTNRESSHCGLRPLHSCFSRANVANTQFARKRSQDRMERSIDSATARTQNKQAQPTLQQNRCRRKETGRNTNKNQGKDIAARSRE